MKRIFILITLFTFFVTCMAQTPTVIVYVDENCEALVPNLTLLVTVSDNCDPTTLSQFPLIGTIISKGITPGIVTALDLSGNESEVNLNITALDTIAPIITVSDTVYAYKTEDVFEMYRTFSCWVQYNKDDFLITFNEFDTITGLWIPEHLENNLFNNTMYIPDTSDYYNCYVEIQ